MKILDGDMLTIEDEFSIDGSYDFYQIEMLDFTGNDTMDIITTDEESILIINSISKEVVWESGDVYFDKGAYSILKGNIDSTPEEELIFTYNYGFVILNKNFETTHVSNSNRSSTISLINWDDDPDLEIIAADQSGKVNVFNGETLEEQFSFPTGDQRVFSIIPIDLNNDGIEEILLFAENSVYLRYSNGQIYTIPIDGYGNGLNNTWSVSDYDNDGFPNVILGNYYSLKELDLQCLICDNLEETFAIQHPDCDGLNGKIEFNNLDVNTRYFLNGNEVGPVLCDLEPGVYEFEIINGVGCEKEIIIDLTIQNIISQTDLSYTVTDSKCGQANGVLMFNNFNESLVYRLDGIVIGTEVGNLAPKTYQLEVVDNFGCYRDIQIIIEESAPIEFTLDIEEINCSELTQGEATIIVSSGVAPYQYFWDGEEGGSSNLLLSQGFHNIKVIDADNCQSFETFEIEGQNLNVELSIMSTTCNNQSNGSARANITDGEHPVYYEWSTGSQSNVISDLESGWYALTATDDNDCVFVDSIFIPSIPFDVEIEKSDLLCYDDQNGFAIVNINEGLSPFTYLWEDGSSDAYRSDLSVGMHQVTVTDANNCQEVQVFEILAPDEISIDANVVHDDPMTMEHDGSIILTDEGGTGTYEYIWNNGVVGNEIVDLSAGLYIVTITDQNWCDRVFDFTIEMISSSQEIYYSDVNVYPNPASNYLILQTENLDLIADINLLSVTGEKINLGDFTSQNKSTCLIPILEVPSGSYFLQFRIGNRWMYKKIIVINDNY